jgi:hypothetical protein
LCRVYSRVYSRFCTSTSRQAEVHPARVVVIVTEAPAAAVAVVMAGQQWQMTGRE